MTTAQTDRLAGLLVNSAIKNPCAVATTAAITLSGEQTIDGVTTSGSRVLVKNQASSIDNGIYVSDSGAWSRAADFNGPRDVVEGTLIKVNGGTTTVGYWYVSTTGSPVPGTDAINFGQSSTVLAVVTAWAQNILAAASSAAAWVFIKVGAIADANTWAGIQTFGVTVFNGASSHTADITMTGASIIEAEGAAVIAASSTNIWATDGNTVHVTGNTGIADFATAPQAGAWMKVIFDGTPTLTQSANLNLNAGGSNITIEAGDMALVYADTTTQMDVFVTRKSGNSVSGGSVTSVNGNTGAVTTVTLLTAVSTTGVTLHDFTVPSGVKEICVTGVGYSTNGTSPIIVQLGDSGGIETSGYVSQAGDYSGDTNSTAGFILTVPAAASAHQFKYNLRLVQAATFLWAGEGACAGSTLFSGAGSKATSAEVTTVRITMANGTDTVDALTYLNVSYT